MIAHHQPVALKRRAAALARRSRRVGSRTAARVTSARAAPSLGEDPRPTTSRFDPSAVRGFVAVNSARPTRRACASGNRRPLESISFDPQRNVRRLSEARPCRCSSKSPLISARESWELRRVVLRVEVTAYRDEPRQRATACFNASDRSGLRRSGLPERHCARARQGRRLAVPSLGGRLTISARRRLTAATRGRNLRRREPRQLTRASSSRLDGGARHKRTASPTRTTRRLATLDAAVGCRRKKLLRIAVSC